MSTKLFVPLLDNGNGSVMASFMMDFYAAFKGRDILMIRASDSHANRGMNKIANAFLDSECDTWINIDADIRFRPSDVDDLLSHTDVGVPLVYGIYPKKEDAAQPCLCTFPQIDVADAHSGLVEVRRCGRGFMLVRREVLEKMKEDNGGPALRFHNHGRRVAADGKERNFEWDFFPSGCVTGAMSALENSSSVGQAFLPADAKNGNEESSPYKDADGFPIREWISEDWYFCERARALGFKTMVDTRIALGHVGQREYRFGGDQVTRMDSNISSWRDIHGWFDYADLYRELAIKIPEGGTFVEIGCWLGKSIAAMAEFLGGTTSVSSQDAQERVPPKRVALHVVDTFQGMPANEEQQAILEAHGGNTEKAFRANMEALGIECGSQPSRLTRQAGRLSSITVHAQSSTDAALGFANESIDAVFIDGDHSEAGVALDIDSWWSKVKPGGWLTGHDIDEPGVAEAVKARFGSGFEVRGRCWLVRKTGVSPVA